MSSPAMSPPVTPGGPNRTLLIGAGVGCGCLSLIVGIVAIILIFSSLGRTQSQPVPQPQPQPQPVRPQPGPPVQPSPGPQPGPQPQPAPQGEGIEGLKVRLALVKVQGEGENAQPGAPSETFAPGETVGAFGNFVEVRGTHEVHVVWFKIEGDKPTPAAKPDVFNLTDDVQGKNLFFRIKGLPAGDFAFAIMKRTGQQQFQLVVARRFRVQ